jgi:hypothetical protein
MNRRAQAHAYPCSSSSSRQITDYLYAIALRALCYRPLASLTCSLPLSNRSWPIPRPRPPVLSTAPATGMLLHWASPSSAVLEPPTAPITLSLHPLSTLSLHSPTTGPSKRRGQPTQQMPQLADANRATTRCPLLCAVALCAARRHSQLLRLPSARLPSARLPGPKCATCATACYKCQSTAKCDVPLCPSLCPSLPRLPISRLTHRRHVKWGPQSRIAPRCQMLQC